MDLLDTLFDAMHVKSLIHGRLEARAPWGIRFDESARIKFGLVVRGHCWLETARLERPIALTGGDCFLLSDDAPLGLRDTPASPLVPCNLIVDKGKAGVARFGGSGAETVLVCGWFEFDPLDARPLLDVLPPLLVTHMDEDQSQLLQSTFALLAAEAGSERIGSSTVVSRLGEILFISAIRSHLAERGAAGGTGWLGALADRRIGAAMRALHAEVGRDWTVETLAELSGMSRSAFAVRFKEIVGTTPMEYLAQWRMYRAGVMLRRERKALGEVAALVGYRSEAAFNRAFKKASGMTPGAFRNAYFS